MESWGTEYWRTAVWNSGEGRLAAWLVMVLSHPLGSGRLRSGGIARTRMAAAFHPAERPDIYYIGLMESIPLPTESGPSLALKKQCRRAVVNADHGFMGLLTVPTSDRVENRLVDIRHIVQLLAPEAVSLAREKAEVRRKQV